MKRFILIAALCVPVAGLATTFDGDSDAALNAVEIRVSKDELANCQQTLRELRQRPVITDAGFKLPSFMANDDLPATVCVVGA
jgi:hypothetical protein